MPDTPAPVFTRAPMGARTADRGTQKTRKSDFGFKSRQQNLRLASCRTSSLLEGISRSRGARLEVRDGTYLCVQNSSPGHPFPETKSPEAFVRIIKKEINHSATLEQAKLEGAFDHFYETNFSGEAGYGTRYIALAHEVRLRDTSGIASDSQHSEYGWWMVPDLLKSNRVHENTKVYFRQAASNGNWVAFRGIVV
jgi:hypothetical protein